MEAHLRESCLAMFKTNRLWIGDADVEVFDPGCVRFSVTVPERADNNFGHAFGGYLMSLIDVAACCVPWAYGKFVVTQTANVQFIKGVPLGERLVVEARSLHHGTTSSVAEVRIMGEGGSLHLAAIVTMHITQDIVPE